MQLATDRPSRAGQLAFNRQRWEELCADPELAQTVGRVETDAQGAILMSPPPGAPHSHCTSRILLKIHHLLGGHPLPDCPISTLGGVRAADVGWFSEERFAQARGDLVFEIAPEICVEVLSPSNTAAEMRDKRRLYFEASALEVWICEKDGAMRFHTDPAAPDRTAPQSRLCPAFPATI
jgi:Uma2 family endonuclease